MRALQAERLGGAAALNQDGVGPAAQDRTVHGGLATGRRSLSMVGPFCAASTLKPLTQKEETIYVVANSDAEDYAKKKFPHKTTKRVGGVLPVSVVGFISGMPIVFQAGQSKGLDAATWIGFLRKERNIVWAIITRKVKVKGPLRLLTAFGRCFLS